MIYPIVAFHENKSTRKSASVPRRRHQSANEREEQERIDRTHRENRILLLKLLEQHNGRRRSSSIPAPSQHQQRQHQPQLNLRNADRKKINLDYVNVRPKLQSSNQVIKNIDLLIGPLLTPRVPSKICFKKFGNKNTIINSSLIFYNQFIIFKTTLQWFILA